MATAGRRIARRRKRRRSGLASNPVVVGAVRPPTPDTASSANDLRTLLERMRELHPEFKDALAEWMLYYAAYIGGDPVYKYIRTHSREHKKNYDTRRARAYYLNFTESVVNLITSFVYSYDIVRSAQQPEDAEPPEFTATELAKQQAEEEQQAKEAARTAGFALEAPEPPPPPAEPSPDVAARAVVVPPVEDDEDLQALWENADLTGTSMSDFMKRATSLSKVFGRIDIAVDMPQAKSKIVTEQQRKDEGLRPYCLLYLPWSILDWEVDEFGQYLWVRIKETAPSKLDPMGTRSAHPDEVYLTWTREEWIRHRFTFNDRGEPTAVEINRGDHPLGRVPLVRLYHAKKVDSVLGLSMVRDIAPTNIAILNYCSLMDEDAYERCLNILVMQGEGGQQKEVNISEHNTLEYTGDKAPFFLAPEGEPMRMLMELCEKLRDEIYRMSRLGSSLGLLPKEAKSGIAMSFEFNETSRMLADTANASEQAEIQIHKMYLGWLGREWEGVVDYPEEFGVESMEEELKVVTAAKTGVRSPTFKRAIEKAVAAKMTTKLPSETRRRIEAEIDQMGEEKPPPFFGFGGA